MKLTIIAMILIVAFSLEAQVAELNHLGQTPGGSAFNLTYDEIGQRLFVGCGASIWVYDVADPYSAELIAMRPFRGMVNEMILDGNVLFAAPTHGGLWALNANSPTLEPFHNFPTNGDSAAYDVWKTGDTIYLANGFQVIVLTYNSSSGFTEINRITQLWSKAMTVTRRNDLIAVGYWYGFSGIVSLYDAHDLTTTIASFTNAVLLNLQDIQFADGRDDILYVCAGTNSLGLTGHFFAFYFNGSTLDTVGHFAIGGVPALANAQIINMDSRNDTLFLATTAGLYGLESDVPVIDATGLPDDSMTVIGHIRPGLWHFDVALFGDEPYMAIASEWYGVWLSDITGFAPLDTIEVMPTGGWASRCYVHGDTVWGCMNGYGLVAWDVHDLYYDVGFLPDNEMLHIYHPFTLDIAFVDDTTIVAARGLQYDFWNLAPWYAGGEPELIDSVQTTETVVPECVAFVRTNVGPRVVAGTHDGKIEILAPYSPAILCTTSIGGDPHEIIACGDTIFVGANISAQRSVAAYLVANDTIYLLAHAPAGNTVNFLTKEGNLIVAALGTVGMTAYRFDGDTIIVLGSIGSGLNVVDVELKNSLLYVAEKLKGLLVYNVSDPTDPILIAESQGSGGWQGMFGSMHISVGNDGKIYLSDFTSGIYVIEPVDTDAIVENNASKPANIEISVYPNPFNSACAISVLGSGFSALRTGEHRTPNTENRIEIFDLRGNLVWQNHSSEQNGSDLNERRRHNSQGEALWSPDESISSGVYVVKATMGNGKILTKRIVFLK